MAAGYTTTTSVAELIPEIALAVDYIYQDKSLGRLLVDYKDVTGQPGNIIEWHMFTEVSASTGVGETSAPASHAMDVSQKQLTAARRSVYVGPSDLAVASATGDLAQQIGTAMGMAMVKAIDASIFGVISGTTNYTTATGATDAAFSLGYAQDALLLLENNEVDDPIYAVVHPIQWDAIRAAFSPVMSATNAYTTGHMVVPSGVGDEMIRSGKGNFYGIDWFVSNRIGSSTQASTDDVRQGLMFAKKGIGYGFKWLAESGIEAQRAPDLGLTKLVLNWADTSGVVYSSAVALLYNTSA